MKRAVGEVGGAVLVVSQFRPASPTRFLGISMGARKDPLPGQAELFRARLENLVDHSHDPVTLAERIDWAMFKEQVLRERPTSTIEDGL